MEVKSKCGRFRKLSFRVEHEIFDVARKELVSTKGVKVP